MSPLGGGVAGGKKSESVVVERKTGKVRRYFSFAFLLPWFALAWLAGSGTCPPQATRGEAQQLVRVGPFKFTTYRHLPTYLGR